MAGRAPSPATVIAAIFKQPFSDAEIRGKFRELAETVLTADGAAAVERAVDHCEDWPDIGALTRLLRQYGRT